MLDASYKATSEGAVLADPIIYPDRKSYEELERLDAELYATFGRLIREEKDEDEHRKRSNDKGPSR